MGRFIEKLGNGSFLFKNGWESIVFVEKSVGGVVFVEKLVGVGFFLKNG